MRARYELPLSAILVLSGSTEDAALLSDVAHDQAATPAVRTGAALTFSKLPGQDRVAILGGQLLAEPDSYERSTLAGQLALVDDPEKAQPFVEQALQRETSADTRTVLSRILERAQHASECICTASQGLETGEILCFYKCPAGRAVKPRLAASHEACPQYIQPD
jgi:hypothetical protein